MKIIFIIVASIMSSTMVNAIPIAEPEAEASPWHPRPGPALYTVTRRSAEPWVPRPGRGIYRREAEPDAEPGAQQICNRPGAPLCRRLPEPIAEPEPEAEAQQICNRPGAPLCKRVPEPEAAPWVPRPGRGIYRRKAEPEANPWHPRPGPALYTITRRNAEPEAEAENPGILAREAAPEPMRFVPLGEVRRDIT